MTKEHWPDDNVEYLAEEYEDGKRKIRWKRFGERRTEFGGLDEPPAGIHLYDVIGYRTLCGLDRRTVPAINVALKRADSCPNCVRGFAARLALIGLDPDGNEVGR